MTNSASAQANPLTQLVETLELQNLQKRDMVLKGSTLTYKGGIMYVQNPAVTGEFWEYKPTDLFHTQMATKLGIPVKYYDRMMNEYPDLLDANINMWLAKDLMAKYMLRTFHNDGSGVARAFLSDRFHVLDNYDVLFVALRAIQEMGAFVKITKAVVTDKRMIVEVVCPDVQLEAEDFLKGYMRDNDAVGNGVISGFCISNSEVGLGTFEIAPRAEIVKCNNGLMLREDAFKRVHLGETLREGVVAWSERTKQKNFELIMAQTHDAVKTFLSTQYLGKLVKRVADANKIELDHPIDAIQHVCHELKITDKAKSEILKYFVNDGDSKASGIFQAITKSAQNMDPDTQFELENDAFALLPKIKKFDKPFSKN